MNFISHLWILWILMIRSQKSKIKKFYAKKMYQYQICKFACNGSIKLVALIVCLIANLI